MINTKTAVILVILTVLAWINFQSYLASQVIPVPQEVNHD
ncbi:hypothetical protein AHIS2_p092 [Acaryochloris phage A-HIS2]|nr:hypothetical protein AHIS2_p092 [Acaryochloris phage A-HIS2]